MTTRMIENKKEVLIPEVEVRISESWVSFIQWCRVNIPHGQVCVELNNGEPGNLVDAHTKVKINFAKKSTQAPFQPFM